MADTTREEQKLDFLIRSTHDSHYRCEYKQDGEYRSSVRCGGCHHSQESYERSIETLKDFIQSEITKARIDERNEVVDEIFEQVGDGNVMDYQLVKVKENSEKRIKELKESK